MNNKYLKSIVAAWPFFAAATLVQNAVAQNYSANVPPVYEEPGGSSKRGADASYGVESIDPFTGALKIVTTDLTIPSNGGLDLQVVRNYHSFQKAQDPGNPRTDYLAGRTATGIGWDLQFGRLWRAGSDGTAPQLQATDTNNACRLNLLNNKNNPVLELPDGSRRVFSASNSTETGFAYITPDRWILKCLPTAQDTGNGGAIVISPQGIKYTFNFWQHVSNSNVSNLAQDANSGRAYHATKIEHPNGTSITIAYVPLASSFFATLDTVTHSEGQSVSFSYTGTNGASRWTRN